MVAVRSKLDGVGDSIFSIMSRMAHDHSAVNLAQGFPDFDGDPRLISLVQEAFTKGKNQYAPMAGIYSLRSRLAEIISARYDTSVSAEEITITAGATQGLYTAIGATVAAGDEVIIFEPAYDSYAPAVRSYQGIPVPIQLHGPDFAIPWEEVANKISNRTKLIIFNSPHNPLGKLHYTPSFFDKLKTLLSETDILLLSDEVYEYICFDGRRHRSLISDPELYHRSMVCYSFGKSLHHTGWKIGYIVAPPQLMAEYHKLHQFNVFSVHHPTQVALAEYLQDASVLDELAPMYQAKRDLFAEGLKSTGFKWLGSDGSYFGLVDYSQCSDLDDMAFAKKLCVDHGVASIPLSPFYTGGTDSKLLRFCFAKSDASLQLALERLQAF